MAQPLELIYPAIHGKPAILVLIEDLLTGNKFLVPMLLDTGADQTCFPEKFAAFFGHDNHHAKVRKHVCLGIGGESVTYIHSVQLNLLDPQKTTKTNQVTAWTARTKSASFVEKLDLGFGLLGMDIMSQWTSVTFENSKKGLVIKIVL